MKIVIDISQYDYDSIIADIKSITVIEDIFKAVKEGKILPMSNDGTIVNTDCMDEK